MSSNENTVIGFIKEYGTQLYEIVSKSVFDTHNLYVGAHASGTIKKQKALDFINDALDRSAVFSPLLVNYRPVINIAVSMIIDGMIMVAKTSVLDRPHVIKDLPEQKVKVEEPKPEPVKTASAKKSTSKKAVG